MNNRKITESEKKAKTVQMQLICSFDGLLESMAIRCYRCYHCKKMCKQSVSKDV